MKMHTNLSSDRDMIRFSDLALLSFSRRESSLKLTKSLILSFSRNKFKFLLWSLGARCGALTLGVGKHDEGTLKMLGGYIGRVYPPESFFMGAFIRLPMVHT